MRSTRTTASRSGFRRVGGLRPGPDLRQPLPVLLHLPAAQGHAPKPLREGRRLPPQLPLRQFHDAHPLHRARRRARPRRGLSPLYISIHTTDPELRAEMLRNPRGATRLRWLEVLLDAGVEVHGQVVLCPGVNDGEAPRADAVRRRSTGTRRSRRSASCRSGSRTTRRSRRCARTPPTRPHRVRRR